MDDYTIVLSSRSEKNLDKMSDAIASPILLAIQNLANNPRPFGYKKLKGKSTYRIRVGDYRVIYDILNEILVVDVVDVGHRKNIYM